MRKHLRKYNKELSKILEYEGPVALVCHFNPDGDAIGSMLGLFRYLRTKGNECLMISPGPLQEFLLWMTDTKLIADYSRSADKIKRYLEKTGLIFMLDFNRLDRINKLEPLIESSDATKVLIDHHPGPDIKADLIISEPGLCSTAELVFELIAGLNGDYFMDPVFVEAIYVGMMTDTGNFNFGTFDGDTMRTVGLMLDAGLDKDKVSDKVYDNFSASRMRFKGYALDKKMVYLPEYKSAYIHITSEEMKLYSFVEGDTEGFVNMPLSISGVIFSAFFIERTDYIKISLRSKGNFDVNSIASQYFNGGGHKNASGGKFFGTMNECRRHFEDIVKTVPELIA